MSNNGNNTNDPYRIKQVSPPFSTGGGGINFENKVQASFLVLLLTRSFCPSLPPWPVKSLQLQARHKGFNIDDFIVEVDDGKEGISAKLLCQVKHEISITDSDTSFAEVMAAAWRDFTNDQLFNTKFDRIALITGPLNSTDLEVRELLDWARNQNHDDFFSNVKLGRFSSDNKRKKLSVIKNHLEKSNQDKKLSDLEFWQFLNIFHLLQYDLDFKQGVHVSLLHSLISQFDSTRAEDIWARLVSEVQERNQSAGKLTRDDLPDDVLKAFERIEITPQPEELKVQPLSSGWKSPDTVLAFSQALLVGSWDNDNENDQSIIESISGEPYRDWIKKIRTIHGLDESRISLKGRVWKVRDRLKQLGEFSSQYYDTDIEGLGRLGQMVLSDIDRGFDLDKEKRFASEIYGRKSKYSRPIREGISEAFAIIPNNREVFTNCSANTIDSVFCISIRNIFENQSWKLWASVNYHLPDLIEACPEELLSAIERMIDSEILGELFFQEGDGFTSGNPMSGLYWALETLAWGEEYLVWVSDILAAMHEKDPGGQWANRPLNSLVEIFLAWLPHTFASLERRIVAIRAIIKNYPDSAFNLLIRLLPSKVTGSSGTHKPKWWMEVPERWGESYSVQEYRQAVRLYASELVTLVDGDIERITELTHDLDKLPQNALESFLSMIRACAPSLADDQRRPIWEALMFLVARHRKFPDADWVLPKEILDIVDNVKTAVLPESIIEQSKILFSDHSYDLFEDIGEWEEQEKKLESERIASISQIMYAGGVELIKDFSEQVDQPGNVGGIYARQVTLDDLNSIFPEDLFIGGKRGEFIKSLAANFYFLRPELAVGVLQPSWEEAEKVEYLKCLPFVSKVWELADEILSDPKQYWKDVNTIPIHEDDLELVASILVKNGRCFAAIQYLYRQLMQNKSIPIDLTFDALNGSICSDETPDNLSSHQIVKLLNFLHAEADLEDSKLFSIEWAFYELISQDRNASPLSIQYRIESDPLFFNELLAITYKSDSDDAESVHKNQFQRMIDWFKRKIGRKNSKGSDSDEEESDSRLVQRGWSILRDWRVRDKFSGKDFSDGYFKEWIDNALDKAKKNGRFDVAQIVIGEALSSCPPDPDGLWVHKSIAAILDEKPNEKMRSGFVTGIYNNRGAYWVDTSGQKDLEIAEDYKSKARALEMEGFVKLASTVYGVAEDYVRESHRVKERHS